MEKVKHFCSDCGDRIHCDESIKAGKCFECQGIAGPVNAPKVPLVIPLKPENGVNKIKNIA